MNRRDTLSLFDRQMRRRTGSGRSAAVRTGDVVRQAGAGGDWCGVVWSGLEAHTADAAIAEQVRYFTALGRSFEWKLYDYDRPADLATRLLNAGFTPEPAETLMVAGTSDLPTAVDLPDGVRLERVTGPAGIDLVTEVHERAFGTSGARLREQLLAQLADGGPDTIEITLALAGDLPVSSARLEVHPGTDFAGLWGGGTLPLWRRRGIYRALIAHRARIAADRGIRYLQVDASAQSRPILERLGFVALATTTPYLHDPH
ncbi:GNAT family N-acetyltransferase [Streptomyces sp. NPDC058572]|uniref:GNAT family N-acetyltransferase n=1 Tax=Streptomyces sp. NPDC058572 TaxID=3346546 RepID=UPI00364633A0